MSEHLLVVEQLSKVFVHQGRKVPVLNHVDLKVERGGMLCVVGPSGAGKSTLLHLIGTLDLPTSGRILFSGQDVTRLSSRRLAEFRNQKLGFVFQFHHLLPEFNALENVMMPGLVRGQKPAVLRPIATELLEEVGLGARLLHRPGELSGGEQQRVALARALVLRPSLVLADEPTGNLDSKTSEAIHALLFDLNQRRGITILVVTHSRDLAARMPRVVEMRDGQIHRDERKARPDATPLPATDADEIQADAAPLSATDADKASVELGPSSAAKAAG